MSEISNKLYRIVQLEPKESGEVLYAFEIISGPFKHFVIQLGDLVDSKKGSYLETFLLVVPEKANTEEFKQEFSSDFNATVQTILADLMGRVISESKKDNWIIRIFKKIKSLFTK